MMGRVGIQAMFYAIFEQGFAVLFSVGELIFCREHFNGTPGRMLVPVAGAAYCAYIMHPVVIFSLTRVLTSLWKVQSGTTPATNVLLHMAMEFHSLLLRASR
jgi:hypothetical protein